VTTQLAITIPAALWMSANQRLHWADKAKRTRGIRQLAYTTARVQKIPAHDVTHVAAFIGYPRGGKADPANAAPTVKAAIDGMVDAGVWPDDDSLHVIGPTFLRDQTTGVAGVHTIRLVLTPQEIPWEKP
jgi:hypothetical protein